MFGENKENKGETAPLEGPAAQNDQPDLSSSTGVEASQQGSNQVPPPPPAKSAAGNKGDSRGKDLSVLLVVGAALLIVALIMSSIALGLILADHGCDRMPGRRMPGGLMNRGNMDRGAGGQALRELRNLEGGGQVSLIRGKVATVQGGNVTIETPTGNETVVVTGNTLFRGADLAGGRGDASSLKAGQQVTVFAKKTAEGKLEAVVVRVGAENAPGNASGK